MNARPGPRGSAPAGAPLSGAPAVEKSNAGAPATARSEGPGTALVPSPQLLAEEETDPAFGPLVARLPVELDVAVPVREFRVRHLLALEAGTVIESRWNHGNDLPLAAGDVKLAWTEFEVIETQLAVRVTRLA
ncbi:MAG TPA: FliM/FliN family flagellar motor C-terminal domain-containing protein [Terracidiphilus sp.]